MELKTKYQEVISIINNEEARVFKDFSKEIKDINVNNISSADVLKLCFDWKSNYLKYSNSKYYILKEYINNAGISLKFGSSPEIFKDFFVFLNGLFKSTSTKSEEILDALAEVTYLSKKSEYYFFSLNELIGDINNNNAIRVKLPPIENFELDILNQLIEDLNKKQELLNKSESIFDKHRGSYEKTLVEKNTENHEQFKLIQDLKSQLSDVNFEIDGLKFSNSLLLEEIKRVDYIPVQQFDVLFWGDNYPALKVLFDFLQKMNMIDFNWSYFSNLMCVGNNEYFNLNTTTISKVDIGYLIFKIKPFFKHEYSSSKAKYNSWLFRKLFIDNSQIDNNYINKYVRGYKSGKNPLKNQNIIDILCNKISLRYN